MRSRVRALAIACSWTNQGGWQIVRIEREIELESWSGEVKSRPGKVVEKKSLGEVVEESSGEELV